MKWGVAKFVQCEASVHAGNSSFGRIILASEQDCSALPFKEERPVSDRSWKRSGPGLSIFVGTEIAKEPLVGKL